MKLLYKILPFLPFIFVFISSLYAPADPDLGWHLKYGEYFFQHGAILRDNTFSALMPNYQWANTSWLTDLITFASYNMGGLFGLTILGAIVVTLTFFVFSKVARLTIWDQTLLFPVILYLEQPINAIAFRGQQLSLLLIGVLFLILNLYAKNPKYILLTIPLFLLWANLHGQFIFGLILFALWITLRIMQKLISRIMDLRKDHLQKDKQGLKKSQKNSALSRVLMQPKALFPREYIGEVLYLLGILIASAVVTVLNPFGIGIHTAALSHLGSPLLQGIVEYLPFETFSKEWWNQIAVAILLSIGFLYLFFRNKVAKEVPLIGTILIVFSLSFDVRRYAWPAYYMAMPLLKPLTTYFKPDNKKTTALMSLLFCVILVGFAIYSKSPFTQLTSYDWNAYCASPYIKCSEKAAEYLKKEGLTENLYTLYGWGGWLIWNHPEIKPTIDGRMHLWRQNGYSAFEDYYAYEQNMKDIDDSQYETVFMSKDKPIYTHLLTLTNQDKWKLVYEDENAGIFVRK